MIDKSKENIRDEKLRTFVKSTQNININNSEIKR